MVSEALEVLNITDAILTILLVGDRKIRKLNREYFHKDRPTNVLAFSYGNGGKGNSFSKESSIIEGDIVVSLDTILSEGEDDYLTAEERIFYYILHGILHIVGFDHGGEEAEEGKMRRVESAIFNKITGKEVA